jgi:hypothetical protein
MALENGDKEKNDAGQGSTEHGKINEAIPEITEPPTLLIQLENKDVGLQLGSLTIIALVTWSVSRSSWWRPVPNVTPTVEKVAYRVKNIC